MNNSNMSNLSEDYSNLSIQLNEEEILFQKEETPTIKMDKKIKVLVIGEVGYYSLFAEGYLRFYSAQKLKIKTTALTKLAVGKKVAKILEDDMIPSKEKLISLEDAIKTDPAYLLLIGDVPTANLSIKTKKLINQTIKIKKGLSLAEERDTIKKKVLKFLDKQGLYGE